MHDGVDVEQSPFVIAAWLGPGTGSHTPWIRTFAMQMCILVQQA